MDFSDSPDEARFRDEARRWLAVNAPSFLLRPGLTEAEAHALGRAWQACKADAGYAGFTLRQAAGGKGGSMMEQVIFQSEEAEYDVPKFNSFIEGWGVVLPLIAAYGSVEQRERFVRPTLRGDIEWCQLFSEPSGGSDAASIRTFAKREGEHWHVNGQKVWTSDAHLAEWGLLLARTNRDVPKHKGLSVFLLEMNTPGIDVRPIKKSNGDSEFNEVFFTDVILPDHDRLGEVDAGWQIAHAAFHAEHAAFSGAPSVIRDILDPLLRLTARVRDEKGRPLLESTQVRERIADYYIAHSATTYTRYRQYTELSRSGRLGFESAISKFVLGRLTQDISAWGLDVAGPAGLVTDMAEYPELVELHETLFDSAGLRIAGGTDEMILNNIAERVLGLPRDHQPDRNSAFKDITS